MYLEDLTGAHHGRRHHGPHWGHHCHPHPWGLLAPLPPLPGHSGPCRRRRVVVAGLGPAPPLLSSKALACRHCLGTLGPRRRRCIVIAQGLCSCVVVAAQGICRVVGVVRGLETQVVAMRGLCGCVVVVVVVIRGLMAASSSCEGSDGDCMEIGWPRHRHRAGVVWLQRQRGGCWSVYIPVSTSQQQVSSLRKAD